MKTRSSRRARADREATGLGSAAERRERIQRLREGIAADIEAAPDPEAEPSGRLVAVCHEDSLRSNFRAIAELVPCKALIPMIKANAYGHGAEWAARILYSMPGLDSLGVATLEEGRQIREAIGARGRRTRILVYSGALPWNAAKGQFCERFALTPVIGSGEDWDLFVREGWPARIPYEIKFNTGMNRLGVNMDRLQRVRAQLGRLPSEQRPRAILSHLAVAEDPGLARTREQVERFKSIRQAIEAVSPATLFHFANSSAIWNFRKLGLDSLTDVVRPGLSLYGVPPWPGAPARGIHPVMELSAQVILVRNVEPGQGIGYGFSFSVPRSSTARAQRVALLGCGYADGLHRALSNRGSAWIRGKRERFLGTISMDVSAVSCAADVTPGDRCHLLGSGIDLWEQAREAGTIPYELLTSLGPRVERVYR